MEKRLFAVLIGIIMVLGLVACGNTDARNESSGAVVESVESTEEAKEDTTEVKEESESTEILETIESSEVVETVEMVDTITTLTTIWDAYAEEEKFSIIGGLDMINDKVDTVDLTDAEFVNTMFHIPVEQVENITEASAFSDMMNMVTFSAVSVKADSESNVASMIEAIKESVINYEGYFPTAPELLKIAHNGNFIIYFYGNEDKVATFEKHMLEVYEGVVVDCTEKLVMEENGTEENVSTQVTGDGLKTNSKGEIIDDGF